MTFQESAAGDGTSQSGDAADLLAQAIAILLECESYIAAAHAQAAFDHLAESRIIQS